MKYYVNAQRIIAFDLDLDKITIHNKHAPLCFGGIVSIDDDLSTSLIQSTANACHASMNLFVWFNFVAFQLHVT